MLPNNVISSSACPWPLPPRSLPHPQFSWCFPKREPNSIEHPTGAASPRERNTGGQAQALSWRRKGPQIQAKMRHKHTSVERQQVKPAWRVEGKHLHMHWLSCGVPGQVIWRSRALERKRISEAKPVLEDPAQPARTWLSKLNRG